MPGGICRRACVFGVGMDATNYQLLPQLSETEYAALKADIAHNGVLVPIVRDIETLAVIDGHHRLRAVAELRSEGIAVEDPESRLWEFSDEDSRVEYALKLNLQRRHLTREQLREQAVILRARGWSYRRIADVLGIDPKTALNWVGAMSTVENSTVELPQTVIGKDGKERQAKKQPNKHGVLANDEAEVKKAQQLFNTLGGVTGGALDGLKTVATVGDLQKAAREKKRDERNAELLEQSNRPMPDGQRRYAVIYADPPWRYDFAQSDSRKIENQYPTMEPEEIAALPIPAADDAVLFMWATNPKLREALAIVAAWGFEYVTNMVWVKDRIGMGYYARSRHELLLIGRRGELPVPEPENRPDSVIGGERTDHSAKPRHVYNLIDRMYPGFPKIELFSRSPQDGWDAWGNEVAS